MKNTLISVKHEQKMDEEDENDSLEDNVVKEVCRLQNDLATVRIENSKLSVDLALAKDRIAKQSRQLNELGKLMEDKDAKITELTGEIERIKVNKNVLKDINGLETLTLTKPVKLEKSRRQSSDDEDSDSSSTSSLFTPIMPGMSTLAQKFLKPVKTEVTKAKTPKTKECFVDVGKRVDTTEEGNKYLKKTSQAAAKGPNHVLMKSSSGYYCKCNKAESKTAYQHVYNRTIGNPKNCGICLTGFYKQSEYDKHFLKAHPEVGSVLRNCKDCQVDFTSIEDLRAHHRSVHVSYLNIKTEPNEDILEEESMPTGSSGASSKSKTENKQNSIKPVSQLVPKKRGTTTKPRQQQPKQKSGRPHFQPPHTGNRGIPYKYSKQSKPNSGTHQSEPSPASEPETANKQSKTFGKPVHVAVKHGSGFVCKCDKSQTFDEMEIFRHMIKTTSAKKCSICNAKVPSLALMEKHLIEVHNTQCEDYPCVDCDVTFKTKGKLLAHRRSVHLACVTAFKIKAKPGNAGPFAKKTS